MKTKKKRNKEERGKGRSRRIVGFQCFLLTQSSWAMYSMVRLVREAPCTRPIAPRNKSRARMVYCCSFVGF